VLTTQKLLCVLFLRFQDWKQESAAERDGIGGSEAASAAGGVWRWRRKKQGSWQGLAGSGNIGGKSAAKSAAEAATSVQSAVKSAVKLAATTATAAVNEVKTATVERGKKGEEGFGRWAVAVGAAAAAAAAPVAAIHANEEASTARSSHRHI
jgi:hypothetical protein